LLKKARKISKYDDVLESVAAIRDSYLEDEVVDISDLSLVADMDNNDVVVSTPTTSLLSMSPLAKEQIGKMFGFTWDRWFNDIGPERAVDELSTRMKMRSVEQKIRAWKWTKHNASRCVNGTNGEIRAFVGKKYAPIDDLEVLEKLPSSASDHYFISNRFGRLENGDRTSNYTAILDPRNLNKDYSKKKDWVFPGYHIRNSEVGCSALTVSISFLRLVCLNGLIVTEKSDRLVYLTHRPKDVSDIEDYLEAGMSLLDRRIEETYLRIRGLKNLTVEDPEEEIRKFMGAQKQTKLLTQHAIDAYKEEPDPTKFGVLQAISRASQQSENVEKIYEIEAMASKYLRAA